MHTITGGVNVAHSSI